MQTASSVNPSALATPKAGGAAMMAPWMSVVNTSMRRSADEARYLVGRHAHHEQEQQRGKDRGPQQRQRDPSEDLPVASAGHPGGLFHAHVERPQGRSEHQIGERKIVT